MRLTCFASTLFVSIVAPDRYLDGQSLVYGSRALSFVGGPSIGGRAEGFVQRVKNGLLAGVERFIALTFLFQANHHIVLRAGV